MLRGRQNVYSATGFNVLIGLIIVMAMLLSGACQSETTQTPETGETPQSADKDETKVPAEDINDQTPNATVWQYDSVITESLTVTSNNKFASVGGLAADQVQLAIPGGSFDTTTTLSVDNPEQVPDVMSDEFAPLGAPVEISAGAPVRLNEPATITLQIVDKKKYAQDLRSGSIWIAYYNGSGWDYFPPETVDADAGTVSFQTYHLSLFGYGKISMEERLSKYTHSQALSSLIQENVVDKIVDKAVEQVIDHMLTDQLGIKNKSITRKILASLANDDAYKDLIDKFNSGDTAGFVQTVTVFAGQKIAENAGESLLQGALEKLSADDTVGYVAAASEAAGYIAEGQYKEAGRILGEHIADKFMVTKIAKISIEVVQYNIDVWKDAEIEAAYKAYKNGADGHFWGYNVDPQDFQGLWDQMRGIATRLQSEAVEREIKRREELSMRPATDLELNTIRAQVKQELGEQFKQRLNQEDELAKKEAKYATLIEEIQKANLLLPGQFGYESAWDTVETRLDKLLHLSKKILRDTGREDWSARAISTEDQISIADMIDLMQAWNSKDGSELYAELLMKKFGIDINPRMVHEDLNGKWIGTMTITKVEILGPAIVIPDPFDDEGEPTIITKEECEEMYKDALGVAFPVEMVFQTQTENSGSVTLIVVTEEDSGDPQVIPYSFDGRKAIIETSQGGFTMRFEGETAIGETEYTMSGPFSMVGETVEGELMVNTFGTFKVVKPIQVVQ